MHDNHQHLRWEATRLYRWFINPNHTMIVAPMDSEDWYIEKLFTDGKRPDPSETSLKAFDDELTEDVMAPYDRYRKQGECKKSLRGDNRRSPRRVLGRGNGFDGRTRNQKIFRLWTGGRPWSYVYSDGYMGAFRKCTLLEPRGKLLVIDKLKIPFSICKSSVLLMAIKIPFCDPH